MVAITVQVDGAAATVHLERVGSRVGDLTKPFRAIRWGDFPEFMDDQFQSQGRYSPEGRWRPLAASTRERKSAAGLDPRILHATLALRRSLTQKGARGAFTRITSRQAVFGTTIEYAAAHQHGKGVPKRQIIVLVRRRVDRWTGMVQQWIVDGRVDGGGGTL